MQITWLGQAGLLLKSEDTTILIDPYLSDSVEKRNPLSRRRVPVDARFLSLRPDVILLTHDHLDHTDPETLAHYLSGDRSLTVLAAENAWSRVRQLGGGHNFVRMTRHTQFTLPTASGKEIRFRAVKAEHSDPGAIGMLIETEGKCLYITGDTLYNTEIFSDLPERIDAVFLPVNGAGNNMNLTDAACFCRRIHPGCAVPIHWGMFDSIDAGLLEYEPKVVPKVYEEICLPGLSGQEKM